MDLGRSEEERFDNAIEILDNIGEELKYKGIIEIYNNKKYKNIFDIIKEKLRANEDRLQEFINYLKNYFCIKNKDLINDILILFKSKKYEMDIISIIFFFEFFQKDNDIWNKKLDKKKFENLFRKNEEEYLQQENFNNFKRYLSD